MLPPTVVSLLPQKNGLSRGHQILQTYHGNRPYTPAGYDVTINFWLTFIEVRKIAEMAASNSFGSNFSGAAFYVANQLFGFFLVEVKVNERSPFLQLPDRNLLPSTLSSVRYIIIITHASHTHAINIPR